MPDIYDHRHADELLEDFALGTLGPEDAAWMRAHIETCPTCQADLGPLLEAVAALPFAAPEPDVAMPETMWEGIERRIAAHGVPADAPAAPAAAQVAPAPREPIAWPGRRWLAVAALMLLSLAAGVLLGQGLPWLNDDGAEESREIAIQFTDPAASGTLRYLPDEQVLVFDAETLPPLAEGQVYQAWLIRGETPVSAGILDPDQAALASVADIDGWDAFAVTIEQGPIGNPAPTSAPILVAPLAGSSG